MHAWIYTMENILFSETLIKQRSKPDFFSGLLKAISLNIFRLELMYISNVSF